MLKAWTFLIPKKRGEKGEKKSKIVEFNGCLWLITKNQISYYHKEKRLYQYA